jgi:SAM-dependent methyltransferase
MERGRYHWSPQKYIDLVEHTKNPGLREYEKTELKLLLKTPSLKSKTIIDVGAGYGRVLPAIAPFARNVFSVEIDDEMFKELKKRTGKHFNSVAIQSDAKDLSKLLKEADINSPVVISFQNSFGTWQGNVFDTIDEMKKIAQDKQGKVIISLHRQQALQTYGIEMYQSVEALVGAVDFDKTDCEKGIFRSKTGYVGKWWTDPEVKEIASRLGGKTGVIAYPNFAIIQSEY